VVEVPSVLWSMWTMPNRSTNFTPFFMVYGSPRVCAYQPDAIEEARKDAVDLLEESRDATITRIARHQQEL
jgi:hypothetical protein